MKRVVLFVLLGPLLGAATMALLVLPALGLGADFQFKYPIVFGLLIPYAYILGIIPALLTLLVDWQLAVRRIDFRVPLSAVFAFALTLSFYHKAFEPDLQGWRVLLIGLTGGIPAAVCSWLSGSGAQQASRD